MIGWTYSSHVTSPNCPPRNPYRLAVEYRPVLRASYGCANRNQMIILCLSLPGAVSPDKKVPYPPYTALMPTVSSSVMLNACINMTIPS
jgi:hypothetical protein